MPKDSLPVIHFESQAAFEAWLAENHATSPGVWLQIAKKGSGIDSVSYPEAVDVALCWGWIDGQKGSLDDQFWLQRFSPRKPGSKWSRLNRERVMALIEEGRVQPPGLAQVEQAQRDGRWEQAYEPQSTALVPNDFQRALDENPRARAFFDSLNSANRYAILFRIQDAKRPETRARRIAQFVVMLEEGKKLY